MKINKFLTGLRGRFIPILIILVFGCGSLYAQLVFSVSYDNLSQDNADKIRTAITTRSDVSVSMMHTARNRNDRDVYAFSLSSVRDSRIVILNEETGRSVVITPTENAPAEFELPPFFIEELRQAVLGDAGQFMVVETCSDFSVRGVASVSAARREVFLPRYFYGHGENAKEFLPKDRQIIHIFKELPRFTPTSDDPEYLRLLAELEEEMSYFVYMYRLSDGTLITFNEHFIPTTEVGGISANTTTSAGGNLQFTLSGLPVGGEAYNATWRALNIWSARLAGTVPVRVNVTFSNETGLAGAFRQPHFRFSGGNTWYSSALGRQIGNHTHNFYDIRIIMNPTVSWHYPATGTIPRNHFDWITVMLHEITHGLGFSSLILGDGSYVYTNLQERERPTNYPGSFDRQLFYGAISSNNLPNLNQAERAATVVSNNLFAGRSGSRLLVANDGNRVRMHAPATFRRGSSIVHWDDRVTFDTFMRHSITDRFREHTINRREVAILRDIGWNIHCPAPTIYFINQPFVSVDRTVTNHNHCGSVNVQNVTITNNAKLTIRANYRTTISGPFSMHPGTSLSVR